MYLPMNVPIHIYIQHIKTRSTFNNTIISRTVNFKLTYLSTCFSVIFVFVKFLKTRIHTCKYSVCDSTNNEKSFRSLLYPLSSFVAISETLYTGCF